VNEKNPAFWHVVALVLDEISASEGNMPAVAEKLGVSTSSVTRFLAEHPKVWMEANRIRKAAGLRALHR